MQFVPCRPDRCGSSRRFSPSKRSLEEANRLPNKRRTRPNPAQRGEAEPYAGQPLAIRERREHTTIRRGEERIRLELVNYPQEELERVIRRYLRSRDLEGGHWGTQVPTIGCSEGLVKGQGAEGEE